MSAHTYPGVIRRNRNELVHRRRMLFEQLGTTESAFKDKIHSDAPLTNDEWAAMTELEEIDFLMGVSEH